MTLSGCLRPDQQMASYLMRHEGTCALMTQPYPTPSCNKARRGSYPTHTETGEPSRFPCRLQYICMTGTSFHPAQLPFYSHLKRALLESYRERISRNYPDSNGTGQYSGSPRQSCFPYGLVDEPAVSRESPSVLRQH